MKEYIGKHSGATLFGIYWTLFFSFLELFFGLSYVIYIFNIYSLSSDLAISIVITLIPLGILFLVINFKRGRIKDYILVGFLFLIPSLFIGGLFILFDGNRSVKQFYVKSDDVQTHNSLEYKLKEIEGLRQRGVISKEEYDAKRNQIISKY